MFRDSTLKVLQNSSATSSLLFLFVVLIGEVQTVEAADESNELSEVEFLKAVPKVLSATRQEQSVVDAPSSTTIISREMIEGLGAFNLAEIMRLVPGFQSFYSNGSTFGVTPHGHSDRDPRRMEVRVNGRSVYLPQLSSVAWESLGILPDDVDHIEVVRGSNVPAYGSNAILGAVNIITRNPLTEYGGSAVVTAGSASTGILNLRQHVTIDAVDVLFRVAKKQNDGFSGVDDESEIGHVVIDAVYTPDLSNSITFEAGHSTGELGIGDGDHLDEFADDHRNASWIAFNWDNSHDDRQWKVHLSFADYKFERYRYVLLSELAGAPPEFIPLVFNGHVDELVQMEQGKRDFSVFNLEVENHQMPSDQLQFVWGFGAKEDRLKSPTFFDTNEYVDSVTYYLFAHSEWKLDHNWVLNAGFMSEDRERLKTEFSPRVSLNYHINDVHHLRLSGTSAYRQPALTESDRLLVLRFENGGMIDVQHRSHPDIDSERLDSIEIGYMGYWFNHDLSIDLKLFREEMNNAIDGVDTNVETCEDPVPGREKMAAIFCDSFFVGNEYGAPVDTSQRVFNNAANWYVNGIEAQLSWRPGARTAVYAQYAYLSSNGVRIRNIAVAEDRDPRTILDVFIPNHSAAVLISHKWNSRSLGDGWAFSGYLSYTDAVSWRSGTHVPGHSRLDLSLAKSWRWSGNELKLSAQIQNATDEDYLEYQANNRLGRRAFVSLSYKWK